MSLTALKEVQLKLLCSYSIKHINRLRELEDQNRTVNCSTYIYIYIMLLAIELTSLKAARPTACARIVVSPILHWVFPGW